MESTSQRIWFLAVAALLLCAPRSWAFQQPAATEAAQKVAATQRRLPWFWSPPLEGMVDLPYAYETKRLRRRLNRAGREILPPKGKDQFYTQLRSLHLEQVIVDGYSYTRCLSQDEKSPCSATLVSAFERDGRKRTNFTAEEKQKVTAISAARRSRRHAFWDDFTEALDFEMAGPDRIRFAPNGKYRPRTDPNTELLTRLKGELRFDPTTYEIVQMEYELTGDADNPVTPLSKGFKFSIELRKHTDGRYLPAKLVERRPRERQEVEESVNEFLNFKIFGAEIDIRFEDPPDKPIPPQ